MGNFVNAAAGTLAGVYVAGSCGLAITGYMGARAVQSLVTATPSNAAWFCGVLPTTTIFSTFMMTRVAQNKASTKIAGFFGGLALAYPVTLLTFRILKSPVGIFDFPIVLVAGVIAIIFKSLFYTLVVTGVGLAVYALVPKDK